MCCHGQSESSPPDNWLEQYEQHYGEKPKVG